MENIPWDIQLLLNESYIYPEVFRQFVKRKRKQHRYTSFLSNSTRLKNWKFFLIQSILMIYLLKNKKESYTSLLPFVQICIFIFGKYPNSKIISNLLPFLRLQKTCLKEEKKFSSFSARYKVNAPLFLNSYRCKIQIC